MHSYRAGGRVDGFYILASSFSILEKYLDESDTNRSVRETCEIVIVKVEWDHSEEGQRHLTSTTTESQSIAFLSFCALPHWLYVL